MQSPVLIHTKFSQNNFALHQLTVQAIIALHIIVFFFFAGSMLSSAQYDARGFHHQRNINGPEVWPLKSTEQVRSWGRPLE
jgi:hypothetical protein